MSRRRKKPSRSPIPRLPEPQHLIGWTVRQLVDATPGTDYVTALRALRKGMAEGDVARIECGGRVLWARVPGGVQEVPAP